VSRSSRARRSLAAWTGFALVTLVGVVGVVGVVAPGARTAAAPGQSTGLLTLVAQTPAIAPDGVFRLQLRVTGPPPAAELAVTVHNRALNRIQFLGTVGGERLRGRLGSFTLNLDETPPDATGTLTIDVPTARGAEGPFAVRLPNAGVYPVVVELRDGQGGELAQFVTHIVRLGAPQPDEPPLRVATIMPIHAPPSRQPDGAVAVNGGARAGMVTAASALQRFPNVAVSVLPTPETVDALGSDPASLDASLLESIRRGLVGRETVPGPYVDMEPSAWLQAGAPVTLAQEFDLGRSTLTNRVGPTDASIHVADPTLDNAGAGWLQDRGVSRLVVAEAALEPISTLDFPVTLTQPFLLAGVDGVNAVMADGALAAHVGESGDPVLDAHHLLADLTVLYLDEPPAARAVVTQLPRNEPLDPAFLEALLHGLEANPALRTVSLATIFAEVPLAGAEGETDGSGTPLARSLRPTVAGDLGTLPQRIVETQADVGSFAATASAANPPADELTLRTLVAASRELSGPEAAAYLRGVRADINAELAHVDLPDRQTFTLTAREGVVPVVVHNDAGYPMSVLLQLGGERLEFPENPGGLLPLELVGEITRVEVTVRTLTSGDVPLTLSVATADGRHELDQARFTVRSTAVSGMGLALIGGSLLFLGAWWGRNIHRARRNRRLVPAPTSD
jgi:hypothetical protein